jgi:hypothetical protein
MPFAVLIEDRPTAEHLQLIAHRFLAMPPRDRPLLLYTYMPVASGFPNFASYRLPRPIPVMPLLIRHDLYRHQPEEPRPSTADFVRLLAAALRKSMKAIASEPSPARPPAARA